MYACELDDSKEIEFHVGESRQLYVKVMEGTAKINSILFIPGDAAEVISEDIMIKGIDKAHIMLIEMPKE